MRAFSRHGEDLQAHLLPSELTVLQSLVSQLTELLDPVAQTTSTDDLDAMLSLADRPDLPITDPALRRLFPDAYRDDEQASLDFRRYTQVEQADAKLRAAHTVDADLAGAHDGYVTLVPGHIDSWLTTLTNLRLVLANRLGIEHESDADALSALPDTDPRAPAVSILNWCGWIQETILATLM